MHDKPFSLTAIVAYDINHGIGFKGAIPWKLPKDMEHFRKTTRSGVVIMGRKTWDSLPVKPLPNRTSIVISREDRDEHGSIWVSSPEEALAKANWLNMSTGMPLFVIGGSEIYKAFADKYTHLIATCVDSQFEHDAVFPSLTGVWAEDLSRRLSVGTSELPATVRYFERKDTYA